MRWIRRNRRIGAWAALFALAVQITLSFGHIHLGKIASSGLPALTAQWQAADRSAPPSSGHHSDANDFCAICATIAMVASSVLPEPSAPVPPVAVRHAWDREFAAAMRSRQAHFSFQARAPPFIG
jgi:hypothetical protein